MSRKGLSTLIRLLHPVGRMEGRKCRLMLTGLFAFCTFAVYFLLYRQVNPGSMIVRNSMGSMKVGNSMGPPSVSISNGGFLVSTPNCVIQDIDPFHVTIAKFVQKTTRPLECMNYPRLTYLRDGFLFATHALLKIFPLVECKYKAILRQFEEDDDNKWSYGKTISLNFTKDVGIEITTDFIYVFCHKNGTRIYEDYHTQVSKVLFEKLDPLLKNGSSEESNKAKVGVKIDESLNVIMVGIDSMSRLNGLRQLPRTRDYILNHLGGIELMGYNRVGDNTFLNMCPLLLGMAIDEVTWNASQTFDDSPFIWKRFMTEGYATLYAEDATEGAAFNYMKSGFKKTPTHHYYRHMALAMYSSDMKRRSPKYCLGPKGCHRWILDYMQQFALMYKSMNMNYFGLSFSTLISHDDINAVGKTDLEYRDFIQTLEKANVLNDTVLIIFGDHGFRFGGIRNTYVGRYAENLPMMMMAFPRWFRKKYPKIHENIVANQRKLTTPFDVHETLRDLCLGCTFEPYRTEHGISLFDPIPTSRTCQESGIAVHFCACREEKKVDVKSKPITSAGEAILSRINYLTRNKRDICHRLIIDRITDASTTVHNKTFSKSCTLNNVCYDSQWHNMKTTFTDYIVKVQSNPGHALFEATVRHEHGQFVVQGDISRTNKYGNTSSCITNDFNLRKFCFCKSNPV